MTSRDLMTFWRSGSCKDPFRGTGNPKKSMGGIMGVSLNGGTPNLHPKC